MMKNQITLTLILLLLAVLAHADIRLPDIFSSHMVLQQQSTVTLWGWAETREKMKISTSWDAQVHSITAESDASWAMQIKTPKAGGPYTITLEGRNTIVLEDIMIGEVWVCSGQSNMGWTMSRTLPQDPAERQSLYNANIRLFNVPHTSSGYPQDNVDGKWEVCSAESLAQFSSVGYFFGKKLEAEMNVPIGLINASWGGTPAESWTPAALVYNDEALNEAALQKISLPGAPKTPGSIYNAMIIVSNAKIRKPVAVRFSFSNAAMSNVFSKEGLPVAPFRTDDWEVEAGR